MKGKRGFNYILVFSLLVIVLVGVTPALAQVCDPTCNPGSGTDDTAKIIAAIAEEESGAELAPEDNAEVIHLLIIILMEHAKVT
jgi:hypothetical protein